MPLTPFLSYLEAGKVTVNELINVACSRLSDSGEEEKNKDRSKRRGE